MKIKYPLLAGIILTLTHAQGAIVITEWMYNETPEFMEFTNIGTTAINMNGWYFSDSNRDWEKSSPNTYFDLSAFGLVAAGESVLLAEGDAEAFRLAWGLPGTIKIIGGLGASGGVSGPNLGRNDEINLYDGTGETPVDRLTYGDQDFPGSIRTVDRSGVTTVDNYGTNNVSEWFFADENLTLVDSFENATPGSYWISAGGQTGNPGIAPVPEPAVAILGGIGLFGLLRRRRH